MIHTIFAGLAVLTAAVGTVSFPDVVYEATLETETVIETEIVEEEIEESWTRENINKLIEKVALEKGVSSTVMHKVIACESGYVTDIQSKHVSNGVREKSYGLVQINLPWNPSVSYEEAIDPVFAVNFLADRLKEGKGSLWTCYRMFYH